MTIDPHMHPQTNHASLLHDLQSTNNDSPFIVLGIALVVDQKGMGARLVFRYPTEPPNKTDLFFSLPSRQMAKLFRPKPALCGQPMTLSIGGTIFGCAAVLMSNQESSSAVQLAGNNSAGSTGEGQPESGNASNDANNNKTTINNASGNANNTAIGGGGATTTTANNTTNNSDLVLFSVVVALAPRENSSTSTITGWYEPHSKHASPSTPLAADWMSRASPSFLCIRRVHLSLARLCRVLEREERRCRYVSLQANMFQRIRHEYEKEWNDNKHSTTVNHNNSSSSATATVGMHNNTNSTSSSNSLNTNNNTGSAPITTSGGSTTGASSPASTQGRKHHRRQSSNYSITFDRDAMAASSQKDRKREAVDDDSVVPSREHELVEIFLATQPPPAFETGEEHSGNLVRELVQVYNSLARNDFLFPPTPSVLLTSRDGLVHINQHIAVAIESVAPARTLSMDSHIEIGPFHTLLFPHASPSQLVETMSLAGAIAPRRLQQVLLMISPQKSLTEVAQDANLPLESTLEIAAHLVRHGACIVSPVLGRSTRLAVVNVQNIARVSLDFCQAFGSHVHLYSLVHYLTEEYARLEDAMAGLRQSDRHVTIREALMRACRQKTVSSSMRDGLVMEEARVGDHGRRVSDEEQEDLLFQMAIWLCSHRVLEQEQDYLVAVGIDNSVGESQTTSNSNNNQEEEVDEARGGTDPGEKKTESNYRSDGQSDDFYFQLLQGEGCLTGRWTMQYCAWRVGLDVNRLYALVSRHRLLRIVTRLPSD
jgi:hypothetical protein